MTSGSRTSTGEVGPLEQDEDPLTLDVLPPASGAWREGDPAGERLFADLGPLGLESGESLPALRVAYETWGRFDGSNAVLVLHALTGDSHAAGSTGPGHPSTGWWDALIGPGRVVDTDRWFVVSPNVLGGCQGTTGPSSPAPDGAPWGSRWPQTTVRDQVAAETALADALGIDRWAAVLGGSMGGMRALEWAVTHPARVERLLLLCCPAAASADQIAWALPQVTAIREDGGWHGGDYHSHDRGEGPHRGLGIARRIAHATYRTAAELDTRFGRRAQPHDGRERFAVESYLDHQAHKLLFRFDAGSYVELTEAMNHHDVARDRGRLADVLAGITARTVVAGSTSDRLYPLHQQEELAALIPGVDGVRRIDSAYGHDAFLVETRRLEQILGEVLRT